MEIFLTFEGRGGGEHLLYVGPDVGVLERGGPIGRGRRRGGCDSGVGSACLLAPLQQRPQRLAAATL